MKKFVIIICAAFFFFACSKETSIEGGNKGTALGADCKPKQIIAADSATGSAILSILTRFDAAGRASSIEIYDSINNTSQFDQTLQYSGDTLRVSADEYFLLDAAKRVKEYSLIQDVNNALETIRYKYTYDASGYLVKKDLFSSTIPLPIPLIQFTYTWAGQNMVAVDGSVVIPGLTQKVFTAALEYDANAVAKNFLPIFPDAAEASLLIMTVDMGKKSRNLIKQIRLTTYNNLGMVDETLTTNFGNYVFSSDGYLIEWLVSGDEPGSLPFPKGKNIFKYFCK